MTDMRSMLFVCVLLGLSFPTTAAAPSRPHILVIVSDDLVRTNRTSQFTSLGLFQYG